MQGPARCLVSPASATSCLPPEASLHHSVAIARTHSELVKFAYHDSDYDNVASILDQMHQRSLRRSHANLQRTGTADVPSGANPTRVASPKGQRSNLRPGLQHMMDNFLAGLSPDPVEETEKEKKGLLGLSVPILLKY